MAVHIKSREDINDAIRYIVKEKGGGDLEYKGRVVTFKLNGFDLFISNSPYSFKIRSVDYKESLQEVYYAVEHQLCIKEQYEKILTSHDEYGNKLIYYYDKVHNKVVMTKAVLIKEGDKVVGFNYKFFREEKNIPKYKEIYDRYEYYNKDYGIVDNNYILHEWDKEFIKDTDIDPEDYRRYIINEFKGKKASPNNTPNIGTYHYKFYFKCDNCGVDTWEWRVHNSSALIDYFPPFLCKECKEKQKNGILGQLRNQPGRFN